MVEDEKQNKNDTHQRWGIYSTAWLKLYVKSLKYISGAHSRK
jgi:hypothetical protein